MLLHLIIHVKRLEKEGIYLLFHILIIIADDIYYSTTWSHGQLRLWILWQILSSWITVGRKTIRIHFTYLFLLKLFVIFLVKNEFLYRFLFIVLWLIFNKARNCSLSLIILLLYNRKSAFTFNYFFDFKPRVY